MPVWYAGLAVCSGDGFMRAPRRWAGERYRSQRLVVDVQLEQIRPRIVADHIEAAPRHAHPAEIDIGIKNATFLVQRTRHDLAARRNDHRVARIDPFVGIAKELALAWDVVRDVAPLESKAAADNPAAAFAGDVLHGGNRAIAAVVGRRDIDLDALRVKRVTHQRHVAFPADEGADAPGGRVDDLKARRIARAPYHSLRVGRHQLAVAVEQLAVGPDDNHRVVQRAAAEI